jgi:tetratricopeptide (TPR) repeat protein
LAAGNFAAALDQIQTEEALSERIGNTWNLAYGRMSWMHALLEMGEYERALAVGESTIPVSDESGFLFAKYVAKYLTALILHDCNRPKDAFPLLALPDVVNFPTFAFIRSMFHSMAVRLYVALGELDAARASLVKAHETVVAGDLSAFGPIVLTLAQGEYDMALGNHATVVEGTQQMQARLHDAEFKIFLTDLVLLEGKAQYAAGEYAAAQATLERALAVADEVGNRRLAWMIHAELATVLERSGNTERAHAAHAAARAGIEYIAAHAPPVLRGSFLDRPDVQALRAKA